MRCGRGIPFPPKRLHRGRQRHEVREGVRVLAQAPRERAAQVLLPHDVGELLGDRIRRVPAPPEIFFGIPVVVAAAFAVVFPVRHGSFVRGGYGGGNGVVPGEGARAAEVGACPGIFHQGCFAAYGVAVASALGVGLVPFYVEGET